FPTPLKQLLTIGRFEGLSPAERWKLLSWLEQLWEGTVQLATDLEHRTAQQWLESLDVSRTSVQTIWNPLARWLTGSDIQSLSADAFVTALRPFFLSGAANSRIWVAHPSRDQLLVEPVKGHLIKDGATLAFRTPAVRLEFHQERVTGVRVGDGSVLEAEWYLAAVPPQQLTPLLPERWLTRYAYFQHIADLETSSSTVLQVRTATNLAKPRHILLSSGPFHWMTCFSRAPDRRLLAVIRIQPGQPAPDLERQVSALLGSLNLLEPGRHLDELAQHEIQHAVLPLGPGTKLRRPIHRSPIPNLLVAGAWTDTGWPANLESAIVSGERCADVIIGHRLSV
ncbi:MAG TPA: FAD-dependent oxidoreductase, partial [Nitrospira sp.]|nr:FAD-dependent oxidoreductase [Nitrospira sp.]